MNMPCHVTPYEGSDPYLFVSYTHGDAGVVYPLMERLAQKGCRIWYDNGIQTGSEWPEVIAAHMQRSAACLLFMSDKAAASHNCRNEMNYAVQMKKPLIPIRYMNVNLSPGMMLMIGSTQWLTVSRLPQEEEISRMLACDAIRPCMGAPDYRIEVQPFRAEGASKAKENPVWLEPPVVPVRGEPQGKVLPREPDPAETAARRGGAGARAVSPAALELTENLGHSAGGSRSPRRRRTGEPEGPGRKVVSGTPAKPAGQEAHSWGNDADRLEMTVLDVPEEDDLDRTVVGTPETVPTLVVLSTGQRIRGQSGGMVLGRSKTCDVTVPDPEKTVGRQHALLTVAGGTCLVRDMDSVNGTWVNGVRLEKGGQVSLGEVAEISLSRQPVLVASGAASDSLWQARVLLALRSEETGETCFLWTGKMELGRNHPWKSGAMRARNIGHEHATLEAVEAGITVTDHSKNGTWLNDERIEANVPAPLETGDRIRLGDEHFIAVLYRFGKRDGE